jgi:rod shape determining protein RodA
MSALTDNLKRLRRMNWIMTLAVLSLLVIGVLFVYSACYISQEQPVRTLYKRQAVWTVVGLLCYAVFACLDYRRLRRFSWWAYAACLFLLVAVLIVGTRIYGARRWLMFFGIGLQPSELAKLATIIVLARKLSRPGLNLGETRSLAEIALIILVPFALIVKEPDLGTALVFLPTAFIMILAAGMPGRKLLLLLGVGAAGIVALLGALFLPRALDLNPETERQIMRAVGVSSYHRERLVGFFRADRDPLGSGWNKRQSEIAVGSGGTWGKGFLKGTQNILGFLPRSVAPTDFIYSVIAEEKGFFGSATVLGLFGLILVSGFRAALASPDKFGRMLCVGIATLVFCHVFVNIAMTVGMMPITGLPLPLLSYGGSFMVVTMSALGMVQSVYIRSRRPEIVLEQGRLWQTA